MLHQDWRHIAGEGPLHPAALALRRDIAGQQQAYIGRGDRGHRIQRIDQQLCVDEQGIGARHDARHQQRAGYDNPEAAAPKGDQDQQQRPEGGDDELRRRCPGRPHRMRPPEQLRQRLGMDCRRRQLFPQRRHRPGADAGRRDADQDQSVPQCVRRKRAGDDGRSTDAWQRAIWCVVQPDLAVVVQWDHRIADLQRHGRAWPPFRIQPELIRGPARCDAKHLGDQGRIQRIPHLHHQRHAAHPTIPVRKDVEGADPGRLLHDLIRGQQAGGKAIAQSRRVHTDGDQPDAPGWVTGLARAFGERESDHGLKALRAQRASADRRSGRIRDRGNVRRRRLTVGGVRAPADRDRDQRDGTTAELAHLLD